MYVACSTLCFGRYPLSEALRAISELGFSKADVAVHETGPHLKPSAVADDFGRAVSQLRSGTGLATAAFHVELKDGLEAAEVDRQLRAVCRLARVLAVPLISLPAAPAESDFDAEVDRLCGLNRLTTAEGVSLTVETLMGTLTETPAGAVRLCKKVPGLGLTLDPSHYVAGPFHSQFFDEIYPYVKHVRLRDSGGGPEKFQLRIGQGEIEYGRIVAQLARFKYHRLLTVDIRDQPEPKYDMYPEVRKLKYLLESLI